MTSPNDDAASGAAREEIADHSSFRLDARSELTHGQRERLQQMLDQWATELEPQIQSESLPPPPTPPSQQS